MTARLRVERCSHGLAVGLCEVGTCKGSASAKALNKQLVGMVKPPRCKVCKRTDGSAIPRGAFYGATPNHPGYQEHFCKGCWEGRIQRAAEAELRKKQGSVPRHRNPDRRRYREPEPDDESCLGE